jgi:hypothetical protein
LLLVLDSNEYIFAFGPSVDPNPRLLIKTILDEFPLHSVRLPRLVTDEVQRNLSPESNKNFMDFVLSLTEIDEDFVVSFELGAKYELFGLKPADSFIAAYTEFVGADALVTENRHFLTRLENMPFSILTAKACLRLMNLPKG